MGARPHTPAWGLSPSPRPPRVRRRPQPTRWGHYHNVGIVRGHLDLLLPFAGADWGPFSWLPWVVFLQPHVIGLLHVQDWWGTGTERLVRGDPPILSCDSCCPTTGLPGQHESQRGCGLSHRDKGPDSKGRCIPQGVLGLLMSWGVGNEGTPGWCPPCLVCPLTLIVLHECPHVPLFWAVCEGAVPHILALAAILRVDAELWGGEGIAC